MENNKIIYIEKISLQDSDYSNSYVEYINCNRYNIYFSDGKEEKVTLTDREFAIDRDSWSDKSEKLYTLINKELEEQTKRLETSKMFQNETKLIEIAFWSKVLKTLEVKDIKEKINPQKLEQIGNILAKELNPHWNGQGKTYENYLYHEFDVQLSLDKTKEVLTYEMLKKPITTIVHKELLDSNVIAKKFKAITLSESMVLENEISR